MQCLCKEKTNKGDWKWQFMSHKMTLCVCESFQASDTWCLYVWDFVLALETYV